MQGTEHDRGSLNDYIQALAAALGARRGSTRFLSGSFVKVQTLCVWFSAVGQQICGIISHRCARSGSQRRLRWGALQILAQLACTISVISPGL
jgi:hypothetical protein